MKDENKTKKQLLHELERLRQRIAGLEKSKAELQRVEEALRESETRYRELVETMNEGLALGDQDYIFTFVNDTFCEMLAYSREELIGRHIIEFIHDDDKELMKNQIAQRRRGEAKRFELTWKTKDGRKIYTLASPRGFFDAEGCFTGSLGVLTDITARKTAEEALRKAHDELERRGHERASELVRVNESLKQEIVERKRAEDALRVSEETMKAILAASPVGIGLVRNRIIVWTNKALYRITGYEEGSLLGESAQVLYPDAKEYERVGREFYSAIEEKGVAQVETQWITKDGEVIHCFLQGSTLHPSDVSKGVILTAMDITDLKRTEEELRESSRINELLLNSLPHPAMLINRDRTILGANRIAREVGAAVGDFCWKTFGQSEFSADEHKGYADKHLGSRSVAGIKCTFCLADEAFDANEPINNPEVEALGQLWDTWWVPIEDDVCLHYAINTTERKLAEEKLHAYQAQLLELASELLLTEERERRRLATDLHDSLGQTLAISKLKLDELRSASSAWAHAKDLDDVRELMGQAIQQTRSLTFELSPPVLYDLGLEAALEYLAERTEEVHGIVTEFNDDKQVKYLNEGLRILLFRAVQELLVNVVKHARARKARISARRDDNHIRIVVEDDGVGFDTSRIDSQMDKGGKFGLFSIRERLHHLGGRFEIDSKSGHGTQVTLKAPLQGNGKRAKGN